MRLRRNPIFASGVALAVVLVAASIASANGGANIASAPVLVVGKQMFGNTGDGLYQDDNTAEYWKLPLIAADKVTIDWETAQTADGDVAASQLYLWAPSTTDFSINNADPLQEFDIGSNNKQESTFTAGSTGAFILMFRGPSLCCDSSNKASDFGGAYDFAVYAKHKLVTHLTSATTALLAHGRSALARKGTFALDAYTADGKPVPNGAIGGTLSGYWAGGWHPLGRTVARGGAISIHYAIPTSASGAIRLQLNVGGGNYQGVSLRYRGLKV